MPDVSSCAPADVRLWVALDVHKLSIVAATLPPSGGRPEIIRVENTPKAIRKLIDRVGGRDGLAVAYEAGPTGWAIKRLLDSLGVACDVIAPSLVPVRPGDRVKTDRRDAKKLVRLLRAGELTFRAAPTPEQEGLGDLIRGREDLRDARDRARQRVIKALLRHGQVFSDGKHWTIRHRNWVASRRLADPVAQLALETMRAHLEMIETQLRASTRAWSRSPSRSAGGRGCVGRRAAPEGEERPRAGARSAVTRQGGPPGAGRRSRLEAASTSATLGLLPRERAARRAPDRHGLTARRAGPTHRPALAPARRY